MKKKIDLIVLCGGLGTRLRSVNKNNPKILVQIDKNNTFLDYFLKNINQPLIRKVILSLGYKKKKVIKYVEKKFSDVVNIKFSSEEKQLGTGGAIKNTLNNLDVTDPFFVINGDTFFKVDFKKIFKIYLEKKKSLILLTKSLEIKRFDQFKTFKHKIYKIRKKNSNTYFINSGLYLFKKKDFNLNKFFFSIENDVLENLIEKDKLIFYKNRSKIFFDIGIPKTLNKFKKYIKSRNDKR